MIAECKRRSPSRGVLRTAYDPVAIAAGYERAGAAAISVLTEPGFFDGSLEHLAAVRAAVTIPLLRKDFIIDEYQLLEARAAGADAILLIVAALDDRALTSLSNAAARSRSWPRWSRCTTPTSAAARSLPARPSSASTIATCARCRSISTRRARSPRMLPPSVIGISESGLKTPADLQAMKALGYRAFLMGERFMIEPDPGAALAGLIESLASRERRCAMTADQDLRHHPARGCGAGRVRSARRSSASCCGRTARARRSLDTVQADRAGACRRP